MRYEAERQRWDVQVIGGSGQTVGLRESHIAALSEDELKKILTNKRGDPLSEDEIKAMYKGNPPISGGKVDYKASRTRALRALGLEG